MRKYSKNSLWVSIILLFSYSCFADEKLLKGCEYGVDSTQQMLGIKSDIDNFRLKLRCKGGISNRPSIRKEYDMEISETNKQNYACGVGLGATLNFYNRKELFNDKAFLKKVISNCNDRQ